MTPDVDELTAVLSRTPAILEAWLDGLPAAWLLADEGPGTFSPRTVLGHLILGERTDWMPRVRMIRAHGETQVFEPFDRFGFEEMLRTRTTRVLLNDFAELRRDNLDELARMGLDATALDARGLHPAFGAVTLGQLLATWATHDLNHLAQIARVMARTQESAVGPWKEYLGVLAWKS